MITIPRDLFTAAALIASKDETRFILNHIWIERVPNPDSPDKLNDSAAIVVSTDGKRMFCAYSNYVKFEAEDGITSGIGIIPFRLPPGKEALKIERFSARYLCGQTVLETTFDTGVIFPNWRNACAASIDAKPSPDGSFNPDLLCEFVKVAKTLRCEGVRAYPFDGGNAIVIRPEREQLGCDWRGLVMPTRRNPDAPVIPGWAMPARAFGPSAATPGN